MASEHQASRLSSKGDPHSFSDRMSSIAEDASGDVSDAAEAATEQARSFADQQKAAGAEQLGSVARAIRRTAQDLEGELPRAAGMIDDAAGRIDRAATALRQRSLDDLVATVSKFAREQPVAFFGTAVLAGFALSRFLKSSGENAQKRDQM